MSTPDSAPKTTGSISHQAPVPSSTKMHHHSSSSTSSSSSSSIHEPSTSNSNSKEPSLLPRPKLATRKSSGTIIIPRDDPRVEIPLGEENFAEDDARAMSPRRNEQDLEKMGEEARGALSLHAKNLHASLLEIFQRIEAVREEHDKLDSNNKFLQKYIGDLMSTSKITSTGGPAGSKRK